MGTRGTDLFVDCVSIPKDDVTANEAREEGVKLSRFPSVRLLLNQQQGLVQRDVFHEIRGVGLGRLEDCPCPGVPATIPMSTQNFSGRAENSLSTTEQDGHDQGMRETDLDTIDEAIPCTL